MTAEHLRFSPDILRRLGEELIPHADQGIVELVRNAYDADATHCQVELAAIEEHGGAILVSDDGCGMSLASIRSGWLVLGRSGKGANRRTPGGRLPVGEKGLGRLAALRLGTEAQLTTRPAAEPGKEYHLTIDWSRYEGAEVVESVGLAVEERTTCEQPGTTIEIRNLQVRLARRDVQRLARALLLLADPFEHNSGFRAELVAPEYRDLEARVRAAYFGEAEYHLIAILAEDGIARAQVFDRSGALCWEAAGHTLSKEPYRTIGATFELWMFILEGTAFAASSATLGEVREWLEVVGGVHIYHRGLRVYPYGDPGSDWLDMNLARARSPEFRPSTNNSIGRVLVPDPEDRLREKTDRTGFIEDDSFAELRRFAQDALNWLTRERVRVRDERHRQQRAAAKIGVSSAQASLAQAVHELPAENRSTVSQAVRQLESAHAEETKTLREDIQLYRTLATVGTTAATFAHETAKPATEVGQMINLIEQRGRRELGDRYEDALGRPVRVVKLAAAVLGSFAALPLKLLGREKRRNGRVDVHQTIAEVSELFGPFLMDAKISMELRLEAEDPRIHGSIAALEAVLANLVTNAVNAFVHGTPAARPRRMLIRTATDEGHLRLDVLDSGPGIAGLDLEEIWLPGRSTMPGGTGLGLTIVRDSMADLGGSIAVMSGGELGGAVFSISLPLARANR